MAGESKFQNIKAPYLTVAEQGSAPATPDTGHQRLFIDSADGHLKRVDEADAVTDIESGGGASTFTNLTDVPASYTGEAGKVVAVNGTEDGLEFVNPSAGSGGLIYSTGTRVDVKNDATEQTVLTHSVPGGSLGSHGALRVTIQARIIHLIVGTLTIRLKYGATTMLTITVPEGTSTADKSSDIWFLLTANSATNAQRASGRVDMQDAANSIRSRWNQEGAATEDSTADKTLAVTVQWGAASNDLEYDQSWAGIELLT